MAENVDEALAKRRRELEEQRLQLEEEEIRLKRLKLEKEKAAIIGEEKKPSNIVELNVGGGSFETSRETLLQSGSPYFERLLESGETGGVVVTGARKDEKGRPFIDRSPDLFRPILEYMRGSSMHEDLNEKDKKALLAEAAYYQLDDLVCKLRHEGYNPLVLSSEDQDIRKEALEIRESFAKQDKEVVASASSSLVDLFDKDGKLAIEPHYELHCTTSPRATVIFEKHALPARKACPHNLPEDIDAFRERFVRYAGPLFQNFSFENVVVAGGAVLSALIGHSEEANENGDVDLFIVANSPETARATYDRILAHFALAREGTDISHHQVFVCRSAFAVTLAVAYPQRNVQVMLAFHSCAAEIIYNFDVDSCQLVFDGTNVWATPSGHRALVTGINLADPERRSVNYEKRLVKYADRGFLVAVPGLELSRVQKKYKSGFFSIYGGQLKHVHPQFHKEGVPFVTIDDGEVEGLAKLLVFALRFNWKEDYDTRVDSRGEFRLRRLESEGTLPFSDNIKNRKDETYLIDVRMILEMKDGAFYPWKLPTPPHPPPYSLLQYIGVGASGSGGGPLICFGRKFDTPVEVAANLLLCLEQLHGDQTARHQRLDPGLQNPLCTYSLLDDVRVSLACPEVEDASVLYPRYDFSTNNERRGELKRMLQFYPSTQQGNSPWIRLDEEGWTDGVYERK